MKSPSGFNGRRFINPYATAVPAATMGKWLLSRTRPKWPVQLIEPVTYDGLTWHHHSTCSIRFSDCHLLTDPIWEKACGPFGLLGPRRVGQLSTALHELKPDLILVSHNHFDHMCLNTLKKLQRPIITGLGNKKYLKGFEVKELDWWESYQQDDLIITYVPAAHFSARTPFDRYKALWGGFVIEKEGKKVYFAGDSGWANHFQEIADHMGPMDYCFLPIGSYKPVSVLEPVHIGPEQAVQLHKLFGAKRSIPIHYRTFQLGDEDWHEPLDELKQSLARHGLSPDSFVY